MVEWVDHELEEVIKEHIKRKAKEREHELEVAIKSREYEKIKNIIKDLINRSCRTDITQYLSFEYYKDLENFVLDNVVKQPNCIKTILDAYSIPFSYNDKKDIECILSKIAHRENNENNFSQYYYLNYRPGFYDNYFRINNTITEEFIGTIVGFVIYLNKMPANQYFYGPTPYTKFFHKSMNLLVRKKLRFIFTFKVYKEEDDNWVFPLLLSFNKRKYFPILLLSDNSNKYWKKFYAKRRKLWGELKSEISG